MPFANLKSYIPARWRGTSPVCELTELIGVSIEIEAPGMVHRFLLNLASAEQLSRSVADAIEAHRPGTSSQLSSAAGSPS